jgi:hypothetical protein
MKKYVFEKILSPDTKIVIEADTIEELNGILAEIKWESLPILSNESKVDEPPRGIYESLQQLLARTKPKTYLDKILLFAYWIENSEVIKNFNVQDINHLFKKCLEKPPQNINHFLNHLSGKKGFLMEVDKKDDKKAWRITNDGINYIKNNLSGGLSGK